MAVVSAVVLSFTALGGNTAAGGEVFLQSAPEAGPDPFTPSTVTRAESVADAVPMNEGVNAKDGTRTLEVDGGYPGLYGGTRNVASCDVEKQIRFLTQHPDKGRAFAASLDVRQSEIASYLRSLTPVRLGWDTRVTNHGYRDGAPTSYQAVLQAGTSVLVDAQGVPRVRCACGNPLDPPVAVRGRQAYSGAQWSSFRSSGLVAVKPAAKPVKTVTVFDQDGGGWYERPSGAARGKHDRAVPAPKGQIPGSAYPVLPAAHQGSVRPPPGTTPDRPPGDAPEQAPGKDPAPPAGRKPGQDPDEGSKTTPDRESGTDPGEAPEKAPGKKPGPDPDEQHGQDPDKPPGQDPGKDPGKESGKDPGKESGRESGKESGEESGRDSGEESGKESGEESGKESGRESGRESGKESGKESGRESGRESGKESGKEPGKDSGKDSGEKSDHAPGKEPGGEKSGHAPDQEPGKDPGKDSGEKSGQDPAKVPGQESGKDSGEKSDHAPG